MSNYELKCKVSELESQLRKIESVNNELRSEISSTVSSVNRAESVLSDYNQHIRNTLDNSTNLINNSVNKAISAYELQGEIDRLYTRYKRVELANKRIRALNNKKYYDFNNYCTVRKIVQGMMDNIDLNMVSDNVIYKAIEKQHLQTPDYWLTCVLISTMAWKSNGKAFAEKAVKNAVKLDKKNSCIFYMIFNLRMGREEAAVKWFMEYQQCELTGSDENTFLMLFSLVSKTYRRNIDDETSAQIKEFINKIILKGAEREGYNEDDILGLINKHMRSLMITETFNFPLLSKCCKSYSGISNMLNLANNNFRILELILKIENVPVDDKNTYLKEFLNDLLARPNQNEKETYEEIEYNELIIRLNGDIEMAKVQFEEERQRKEAELDLVSSIISWVYDFSLENVNGQMRLNMFTLIKDFQEKASQKYFENYRAMYKKVLPIEIGEYSADVDFSELSRELDNINKFYEDKTRKELAQINNIPAYIGFGAGAASFIAAFSSSPALLGVSVICIAGGLLYILGNNSKKKNIVLGNKEKQRSSQETLQKLFAEYGKCEECYHELDAVSIKIMGELAKV